MPQQNPPLPQEVLLQPTLLLQSKMNSSSWMMGLSMLRSRNLSSPMSPHKEEERRKAEVEAEVVKEEEDSREVITQGRTILIEDNPIEVAGNLEVEEEEVVMTGAQIRESLEWLAEPLTRTGVTTAMSLDISQENAPRGIMAITTIDHSNTRLFQDLMWFNHRCMLRCQFLKWLKFQFRWHSISPSTDAEQQHDRSDSCHGTHERGDDADARCDCR